MHNKTFPSFPLILATLAVATLPASAGVISIYTDPGSWAAALNAATTGLVFSNDLGFPVGASLTSYNNGPFTFTGTTAVTGSATTDPIFANDNYISGDGLVTITIDPLQGVYAIGVWEACAGLCAADSNLVQATSTTSTASTSTSVAWIQDSNSLFYGFISDAPLTSVSFASLNGANVAVGDITSSETPEAATLLLIGTGLVAMARMRRSAVRSVVAV